LSGSVEKVTFMNLGRSEHLAINRKRWERTCGGEGSHDEHDDGSKATGCEAMAAAAVMGGPSLSYPGLAK
jgi:hypothetical protein